MTDIVERLRAKEDSWTPPPLRSDLKEAADEIEGLRYEISELKLQIEKLTHERDVARHELKALKPSIMDIDSDVAD